MTRTNRRRFPILLASALALLAILGALFLPDRAQAQSTTEIWSATMSVGQIGNLFGFINSGDAGSLSDWTFSHAGTDYTIIDVFTQPVGATQRAFHLSLNKGIRQSAVSDLTLVASSDGFVDEFVLANGTIAPSGLSVSWITSGLSWSAGTDVSLSLKAITGRPELNSSAVGFNGDQISLIFDENLGSPTPPKSAFSITADESPISIGNITRNSGLLNLLSLSPVIGQGQTVKLTYTDPTTGDDSNAIQDTDGVDAHSFTVTVGNQSTVTLPALSAASVPADGGTVALTFSRNLDFSVTFTATIQDAFSVTVDGTANAVTGVSGSGDTATLTMADTIAGGQTVVVGYDRSDAGGEALGTSSTKLVADFTTGADSVPAVTNNSTAGPARLASATVDAAGTRLTLTFNKSLNAETSARAWFTVTADGAEVPIKAFQGLSTAGDNFTILFYSGSPIYKDEAVVVVYEKPADSDGLTDEANDVPVASFTTGQDGVPAVTNDATTVAPPEPDTAASISKVGTGGSALVLAFDGPLATDNTPPASAFSITAGGVDIGVNAVLLSSNMTAGAVTLAGLTPKVRQGETVELTYTDPTSADDTNALQGTTGTDVHSFTVTVTNASTFTTGPPRPPTGLTATALGATIVDLAWTAPANDGDSAITGYKVQVSNDGSSNWIDLAADTGDANAWYRHTGLSDGETRYYRVSAINANGTSPASGSANATTMFGDHHAAPADIYGDVIWSAELTVGTIGGGTLGYTIGGGGLAAAAGALSSETFEHGGTTFTPNTLFNLPAFGSVQLSLDAALGAGKYNLHLGPDRVTLDGLANGLADSGNNPNINYWQHGDRVDVRLVEVTAPAKPTGLMATAAGNAQIDLAWTAPADDGGRAVSGYKIGVSDDGSTGNWDDLVADTASTDTAYSHTGLSAGDTRHYRVSAINAVGTSDASDSKDATTQTTAPEPPTGVAAIADGTSKIVVSWSAPENDGGSAITGYMIEVSRNGTTWPDMPHVADTGSTDTSYTHTGLSPGDTRHYRVSAINANGTSEPSDSVEETTAGPPTLSSAEVAARADLVQAVFSEGLNLSSSILDAASDALSVTADDVGIPITRVHPGGINREQLQIQLSSPIYQGQIVTLSYDKSVAGSDAIADSDGYEVASFTTGEDGVPAVVNNSDIMAPMVNNAPEFAVDQAIFTVPENSAAGTVVGTVTATDDDDDTLTYSLEGTDAASFEIDSGTGQIKTKTGVTYNYEAKQNSYEMTAKADDGNGGTDTIDVAVTLLDDHFEKSAKPAKPTLAAVPGSSTSLAASWSKPDLNGGPDITGYDVQYRQTGGSWTNFAHSGTAETTTITGLTANTEYQVRVQAKNGEGDSDWSDASDAARTNAVDIPIPPGLVVTLHLSDEDGSVLENHGWVTVTATASPASPVPFTVTVSADPVAPATEDDFTLSTNRVLSFAANETGSTGTVRVAPIGDDDPEPPDVVTVSGAVSNPAIRDPDDVTLTIRNDDADLPQDVAVDAPAAVEEDAGTAVVTVTLTTRRNIAPVIDVDLYYYWRQETATRGEDYTLPHGQVFASNVLFATVPTSAYSPNAAGTAWVAQRSFTIGIVDDREAEGDETIVFRVETSSDESPTQTIAIRDDDTPVLRNVRLVGGPGSDGVWRTGERVYVEVRYSLPVVVERPDCWPLDAGTCRPPGPYMVVAFRSDARPGYGEWLSAQPAPYVGGSGTATLRFAYRVGAEEDGALRVVVADNGMFLRGATIRPLGGGDAELSEYTNTRVRQVNVVRPGGGVWTAGDTVRVKVRFAGPVQYAPSDDPQNRDEVFVDERRGTPTIRLRLGEAPNPGLPRTARYERGSGTDTLTFEYAVRAGDGRVSVVEAVADSLAANGATIRNEDGYDAELHHVDVLWYSPLALRVRHATAREGEPLRFTMELARASQAPVTVDYETADGTATAGQDYTAKRGTVTFTPGRTRRTVEVPVLRDGKVEGVETMVLRLSNARSEGSEVPVEMKVSEAQGAIENVASEVNTPATGVPTINGTAQVGETLTADTSGIADRNGLENATFNYQWLADHAKIAGANSSTRTLTDVDQGKAIKVRVSFTDDAGYWETLTSAPTEPVLEEPVFGDGPPGAPRNLTVTAGDQEITLSWEPPADNGNAPATRYRIEWRIDGKDYGRSQWGTSRSTTYTKTHLANGVKYVFRVKAENGNGNSYGPYGPASEEVSGTPTSGSAVDLGTPVLSEPETLHHGMVRLDWEDIEGAGWYVVQYYHVQSGEWLDLPAAGVDVAFHGSSAVVSNLHGLSWLRVRAMSCGGESEWSQIEQLFGTNASDWEGVPVPEVAEGDEIEPCPAVLGTPVLSRPETLHHGMVSLDWQDIEDAGWYVVQYYHVKGGEWLDLPAAGVDIAFHGSSAVVSNLHGLSWLRVRAMSCAGESEWSQIEQLFGTNESDWEGVPVPEVAEGDEIEPCPEDADTPGNSPATGAPAITGTAQVGQTLTANTSGIADSDGLTNATYRYQWLADDAAIAGAMGNTYTLVAADEGKAISVRVSFTDDAGNDETLTSAATAAVAAGSTPNSPATGAPTISGTAQVGETLTANTSEIVDEDGLSNVQYEYQWLADDTAIAGATALTYTLVAADEGKAISMRVSFTDDAGNDETLTSGATDAAAAAQPTEPPARPTGLSATASHDSVTLTWDDPPDDSITGYVILRRVRENDEGGEFSELVANTGSAAAGYTDDAVAAGITYTYRIKAINEHGVSERSRWLHIDTPEAPAPDTPPERDNSPATGAPTINGTAQVGETLNADTSGIADADGLEDASFSYQWLADDSNISGATGETYTLADADEAKAISVTVSFTDDADNEESLTSEPTAEVAAKPNSPATGQPAITGAALVEETLTADTSGIADADGLDSVSYSYQWLAEDAEISGATDSTYTLASNDVGRTIKVRVSFTDDRGHGEELTSADTEAVAGLPSLPLTASLENVATSHDGESVFTFELRFSEEFGLSYKTLRDHAFTVTGGAVRKAGRLEQGSNMGWKITVRPDGNGDVTVVLPVTTDCDDQGAICTGDGRKLSNSLELTVSGPGQ